MSIDPRVIADFITEDIYVFNEGMIFIESETRREFLKKLSGYGAYGMLQDPVAILKKVATGSVSGKALAAVTKTVSDMSNDELLLTPEELWLPYISDKRLANFMSDHPDHFHHEVIFKFYVLVNYLNSGLATKSGVAKRLIDLMNTRAGVNPSQVLNQAFSEENFMFDIFDKSDVIKAAKSNGISLDYDLVNNYYKNLDKKHAISKRQYEERKQAESQYQRRRWEATVHGGVEPDDWSGYDRYSSDVRFESINEIALMLE